MANKDFKRLSERDRSAYRIENLPDDIAAALEAGLEDLRVPEETREGQEIVIPRDT